MVLGDYTHKTETSGITLMTYLSGQTQRRQRPILPAFTCAYLWLILGLPFSTAIFSLPPYSTRRHDGLSKSTLNMQLVKMDRTINYTAYLKRNHLRHECILLRATQDTGTQDQSHFLTLTYDTGPPPNQGPHHGQKYPIQSSLGIYFND